MAVHLLAVEILNQIFELALPTPYEALKLGRISFRNCPWSLIHVCSQWRAVALSLPVLWSRITISIPKLPPRLSKPPYPLPLVNAQILLFGTRPLQVIFLSEEPPDAAHTTKELFALIHKHCHRWETARIEWCLWDIFPIHTQSELPLLRELFVCVLHWNHSVDRAELLRPPQPMVGSTPKLNKLGSDLQGPKIQLDGLAALNLRAIEELTVSGKKFLHFLDMLGRSESQCSLRKLWLKDSSPPVPDVLESLARNPGILVLRSTSGHDCRKNVVVVALTLVKVPTGQDVAHAPALTTYSIDCPTVTLDQWESVRDMVESRVRLFRLQKCVQL
ncbi:hypothetical protein C8R46DRAFT_1225968 [Mycena filopes]|nr:hypothetical protein C8R46DRAFT_1225968 [Mycena filopes]